MNNVAFYIKQDLTSFDNGLGGVIRLTGFESTPPNIVTKNIFDDPVYNVLQQQVTNPSSCDDKSFKSFLYNGLATNNNFTCNGDILLICGEYTICSRSICKGTSLLLTSDFDTRYTGLVFRLLNDDNKNYIVSYSQQALQIVNYFQYNNNKVNLYAVDNITECSENPTLPCCLNTTNCSFTSSLFYVVFTSQNTAIATSTNGYLYFMSVNNNYVNVDNVIRPTSYYDNTNNLISPTLSNFLFDKYNREILPAFAINNGYNTTIYSVSDQLFRIDSISNIIHYNFNNYYDYGRYNNFIVDLEIVKNNQGNIEVIAILAHMISVYVKDYECRKGNITGFSIIHYKYHSANTFQINTIFNSDIINFVFGSYIFMEREEHFYRLKNILRIKKIDDNNLYATIATQLFFDPYSQPMNNQYSFFHIKYDGLQATIQNIGCAGNNLGVLALAAFNTPTTMLSTQGLLTVDNIELLYQNLSLTPCVSNNLIASVPLNNANETEMVVNDIITTRYPIQPIRLIKCDDPTTVIYPSSLSNVDDSYIGKVVQIYGHYKCCFIVSRPQDCLSDEELNNVHYEYVLILNTYDTCLECQGIKLNNITYDLKYNAYKPGINVGTCDVEKYIFTRCKFGEAIYKKFLTDAYKIKTCCNDNVDEWWVKNYLIELESMNSNLCTIKNDCNEICITDINIVNYSIISKIIYNPN